MTATLDYDYDSWHPWTQWRGWSQLSIHSECDADVVSQIELHEKEGWHCWIHGKRGDIPAAVMYRPFPFNGNVWTDSPLENVFLKGGKNQHAESFSKMPSTYPSDAARPSQTLKP